MAQDYRIQFYDELNSIDSNSMCFPPSHCADVWVFSGAKYYRDTMERSAGSRSTVGSAELDGRRRSASVNPAQQHAGATSAILIPRVTMETAHT